MSLIFLAKNTKTKTIIQRYKKAKRSTTQKKVSDAKKIIINYHQMEINISRRGDESGTEKTRGAGRQKKETKTTGNIILTG